MQNKITGEQLRSFGFTVGGIFALIALWPMIVRAEDPRWWVVGLAVFILLPAVVFPNSLAWVYQGWTAVGHALGWINTRIILGIVFYLVVTPIGLLRRWLGKDPMGRRLRPDLESYRIVREPRPGSHLKKQY
jgi:Saxitoxin biosynthesis operon protein SxtJ